MLLFLLASLLLRTTSSSEISSTTSSPSSTAADLISSSTLDSVAALEEDSKSLGANVTLDEKTEDDPDLKQLSGLDIRWGGERGNHNLVLGKKQERDELLLRYVCKKDGRWLRTVTDEVMWPLYGRKPTSHIIHYVEALDQEVGGRGGFASITRGGVSHKNVTISLKSQRNYGINFIVSIYGSPEYHETYEDTIVINEKPDKYGVVQAYRPQKPDYLPQKPDYHSQKPEYLPPKPAQEYGIDSYQPTNNYQPQLGQETDHHSYKPNYGHTHEYSPIESSNTYGAPPPQYSSEENEDTDTIEAKPGIYIEQHQYKPTYNPYRPSGAYKPQSNLNAELYLSSKPKPNVYSHNVEAYKPGEYYVHHQQNYYAKPQKYH